MTEYEELPRIEPDRIQYSNEDTGAQMAKRVLESTVALPDNDEQAAAMPDFTQILRGVPNRFSEGLDAKQQHDYREASGIRWDSLRNTIAVKCGIAPEIITEEWVLDLLDSFARQPAAPQKSKLPKDYKVMYAAMLWEHLQGAPPAEIKKAAKQRDWIYGVTEIYPIRQAVVRYAIATRKVGLVYENAVAVQMPYSSKTTTRGKERLPDREYLDRLNREIEDEAIAAYRRPEIGLNLPAERLRVANLLGHQLEGNLGAYYEILNLLPEVIVEDEDRTQARTTLFATVSEMARPSVSGTLPEELRLDIEEARWLVMLCGKELVTQGDKRFVRNSKRPFGTIQDIRNHAHLELLGKKSTLTPEEAERTTLAALDKVVQYKKIVH